MKIKILSRRYMIILFCMVMGIIPVVAYAEDNDNVKENNKTYYSDAYWAGHDDDFAKEGSIDSDDYNYGWEIGKFSISGYSARMVDNDGNYIFLKNVGDEINLWFLLEQDIFCLNGNDKLYIRKLDSRDEYFQTENIDFGRGTLIIRHTDYQGIKHDPVIYTNYLEALEVGKDTKVSSEGPNTSVYLLEEGDYEVALDYRVAKEKDGPLFIDPKDPYQDFRIFFKFSIRNGNCMTFIRDAKNGNELTNESVTPNGFVVDMANSKYLQVNIKKEVMSEGRDGLVEDVRFNRPVSDGEAFTDEGMYTLTIKNVYTDESTVKKIYVGTDEVMIACVNSNYSIEKINNMLAQGCTINEDGSIEWPLIEEPTTEFIQTVTDASPTDTTEEHIKEDKKVNVIGTLIDEIKNNTVRYIAIVTTVVVLLVILLIVKKRKKKKLNK